MCEIWCTITQILAVFPLSFFYFSNLHTFSVVPNEQCFKSTELFPTHFSYHCANFRIMNSASIPLSLYLHFCLHLSSLSSHLSLSLTWFALAPRQADIDFCEHFLWHVYLHTESTDKETFWWRNTVGTYS